MSSRTRIQLKSLEGHYTLGRLLGEGSQGYVYFSPQPGSSPVVVKIFKKPQEAAQELKVALEIKEKVPQNCQGIAQLVDNGTISSRQSATFLEVQQNSLFLVYQYYEHSLKDLWASGVKFSKNDFVEIGIQLLDIVENIHKAGFVHSDIKLDNIMVNSENKIFLIDYGCAQTYELANGSHRQNTEQVYSFWNVHFGSNNFLRGHTLSRRDDVIQIIYNLMCLQNSFAPLFKHIGQDDIEDSKFSKFKCESTARQFCIWNESIFFIEIMKECYSMKFEAKPNYSKLKFLLQKIILKDNKVPGGRYFHGSLVAISALELDEQSLVVAQDPVVVVINKSKTIHNQIKF